MTEDEEGEDEEEEEEKEKEEEEEEEEAEKEAGTEHEDAREDDPGFLYRGRLKVYRA